MLARPAQKTNWSCTRHVNRTIKAKHNSSNGRNSKQILDSEAASSASAVHAPNILLKIKRCRDFGRSWYPLFADRGCCQARRLLRWKGRFCLPHLKPYPVTTPFSIRSSRRPRTVYRRGRRRFCQHLMQSSIPIHVPTYRASKSTWLEYTSETQLITYNTC
ncbi:uncharacterized protein LOC119986407 [Tripterygium wilfordii]|uniref:uncharacterized protein LOC119986407 n=1 Tax=Tripterygium wilfordii TaxID=458696 RepID=UPI0018F819E9|nr:uncharacterized protein LOC119986407 [Tripterygium wilfordii]